MNLDAKFGSVRSPSEIRKWEDRSPDSVAKLDAQLGKSLAALLAASQHGLLKYVAQSTNYLWVMDASGDVWIAVEELAVRFPDLSGLPMLRRIQHPADTKKLGHPTLVANGPARIAGELAMDERSGQLAWIMNAQSGRYCRKLPPTRSQVESVAALFATFGLHVQVDHE
ncbi:MAG: hypothetical protein ACO1OG_00810 [Devosia sp.]